ncbi:putative inositol monophosphatase 3 [Diprion similis]|uniref:putative inositol monophosphatase 3 n=1 Tax=Diprion similis TaxID=362088 RepID=UPI001EF96DF2|nr:putative inositol monophosphatase 3 [Diprion similis]
MHLGANVRVNKIGIGITIGLICLFYLYSHRGPAYSSIDNRDVVSMKALLAGAIKVAEIGGLEVISVHDNLHSLNLASKGKTKEGVNDPVTAADYRSHCAMYHALLDAFPRITIKSEEKSIGCDKVEILDLKEYLKNPEPFGNNYDSAVNANDITVWIDPLDATKEYTENLLQYVTTMVCVAIKGQPVMGVIHKPFDNKQTYWAWVGHGQSANLHVETPKKGKPPVLIVSRSHAGRVYNASKSALGQDVQVVSAAGSGYKSLEVVVGNATAYVHMTAIKKWDICAGAAIISALGGKMTPLSGPPPIGFGPEDDTLLNTGLMATMNDHQWYLDKFYTA